MVNPESSADITMFWLKQLSVVFVLNFYFLNESFRKATNGTLNIKHTEKAGPL